MKAKKPTFTLVVDDQRFTMRWAAYYIIRDEWESGTCTLPGILGCQRCGTICKTSVKCQCCLDYDRSHGHADDGKRHVKLMDILELIAAVNARSSAA